VIIGEIPERFVPGHRVVTLDCDAAGPAMQSRGQSHILNATGVRCRWRLRSQFSVDLQVSFSGTREVRRAPASGEIAARSADLDLRTSLLGAPAEALEVDWVVVRDGDGCSWVRRSPEQAAVVVAAARRRTAAPDRRASRPVPERRLACDDVHGAAPTLWLRPLRPCCRVYLWNMTSGPVISKQPSTHMLDARSADRRSGRLAR